MKSSGMVLMIFLRKGCESCIHTSSYLTLLPSAFLPPFSSHSSVFKPVYTHPPLLVKLCAGTVGYLKMSARLWQVWSSLGSQLDKPSGKKGLSTHPHALSSQALAVKTLETFTSESLTLSSLFHWYNTEQWNSVSCPLPGRGMKPIPEWGFGASWLQGISPGPLAQASRSRSWAAIRDRNRMFPAGGLNTNEWNWKFP